MPVRPSLITKLTLAISLILICFMGLLDYINLRNFRNVMIEYATSNADQVAGIIRQSTHDAMLKNDKEGLYRMISRIAQSTNIERIRLIDRNGTVAFSTTDGEQGKKLDATEAPGMASLISGSAGDGVSSRVYRTFDGAELLDVTQAIGNRPVCATAACHFHHADTTVLGVLDISISLKNLQRKSNEYRMQFIVMTCLLLVLIGVLITFLIRRTVNRPVRRLMRHTARVAGGNLEERVVPDSHDELGELCDAFNEMTENLLKARKEIHQWTVSLERKVEERSNKIQRMQEQLHRSEKLASLGNLVAGIAHEINNPLTGVLLYAAMLDKDKRLDPALKPDLERIISETRRCAVIVKQLLEFSREAVPNKETVNLNTLLDKVINLLEHQPDLKRITIIRSFDDQLPEVFADPNQIQQVFMNLLINAGQAITDEGEITVTTQRSQDGQAVCATVADNGRGIPAEQLDMIFDPFFTTKSEGTGLGLSISYGLVKGNGGTIEAKSEPGAGTVFTVALPVKKTP